MRPQIKLFVMRVKGFRTYIGQGLMRPDEAEEDFVVDLIVKLKLLEGNEIGGIGMKVASYDNRSGYATVMFDRPITEVTAKTLLDDDDLFIFE